MPFEIKCQGCSRPLRIADEHAGKKARCPHCGMIFDVPPPLGLGGGPTSANVSPIGTSPLPSNENKSADAGNVLWQLKTEDGNIYGPVSRSELERWANEGRVTPNSSVSVADQGNWQLAKTVFPWLAPTTSPSFPTPNKPQQPFPGQSFPGQSFPGQTAAHNPFAGTQPAYGGPVNPYAATTNSFGGARHFGRAHRGGLILTLGIIAIVFCIFTAPFAWIMGSSDLKQMKTGQMDPSGQSMTQAGMVMGIIGTILMVLVCGFYALAIVAQVGR